MRFSADITGLVGGTPLVRLNRMEDAGSNLLLAKLEQFNPAASVKDRAALSMIRDAEQRGALEPGGTIIEATSGNTGIALAWIAAARGYRLVVVMPDSMSFERRKMFELFGAGVELTPVHLGMKGAVDRARELHGNISGSFLVSQFDNPANPAAHERTTAGEILRDTDGSVDVVVGGVGTGGTITGIARGIKKSKPRVTIIAVEPAESAVLSGGKPGCHMIQGIGAGFVPAVFDQSLIDGVITVTDEEAVAWARKIIRTEGICAGISSGAAVCAARKYILREKLEDKTIVILFPDSGERYLSWNRFAR